MRPRDRNMISEMRYRDEAQRSTRPGRRGPPIPAQDHPAPSFSECMLWEMGPRWDLGRQAGARSARSTEGRGQPSRLRSRLSADASWVVSHVHHLLCRQFAGRAARWPAPQCSGLVPGQPRPTSPMHFACGGSHPALILISIPRVVLRGQRGCHPQAWRQRCGLQPEPRCRELLVVRRLLRLVACGATGAALRALPRHTLSGRENGGGAIRLGHDL